MRARWIPALVPWALAGWTAAAAPAPEVVREAVTGRVKKFAASELDATWTPAMTPPLPAAWPPDGNGELDYYAYVWRFEPDVQDAEQWSVPWLKLRVQIGPTAAPDSYNVLSLERLTRVVRKGGRQGVRPLDAKEAAVLKRQDEAQAVLFAWTRGTGLPDAAEAVEARPGRPQHATAAALAGASMRRQVESVRESYCLWAKLNAVAGPLRQRHAAFFDWLRCAP